MSDRDLLRQYASTRDDAAFRRLVAIHIDFVYSSARRQVRDPHLAEDVTQVVFLILARKAATIPENVILSGWLFNTTRYAAADALKARRRREHHERKAAEMIQASQDDDQGWERLSPYLEEGLAKLGQRERDAVLLRFFRGMSLAEVGSALGISEDAAAQRVSRAVARLRGFFVSKGFAATTASLTVGLSTAVHAAPASLAGTVAASVTGGGAAPAVVASADTVTRVMVVAKAKLIAVAVAAVIGTSAVLTFTLPKILHVQARASGAQSSPYAVVTSQQLLASSPELAAFPYAKGWPLALPGQVTGTPTPADLDGDGDLEILIPSMHSHASETAPVHPAPRLERLLYAFHHDGTPVKGWPAVIMDLPTRVEKQADPNSEYWSSHPSVIDYDRDGRDEVVILDRAGTVLIEHDKDVPVVVRLSESGDGIGSAPLADINGDGTIDIVMGHVLTGIDGKGVRGWPSSRTIRTGFAPAIADANRDGKLELYHPSYVQPGTVAGYDATGQLLPGWPRKVMRQCWYVVVGDIAGDEKLEVVANDQYGNVFAWTWDGKPLSDTSADGELIGVIKTGVGASSMPLTLADIDADGKSDIVVFDAGTRTLRAWRGDGTGITRDDGTIVHLPDADCSGGVSVSDLGSDGVLDLFVAHYWIKLQGSGDSTVINMLPSHAPTTTQPTIVDIDRDGKADVLFALSDGRAFIYQTGVSYSRETMLWFTPHGNYRRTGSSIPATAPTTRRD